MSNNRKTMFILLERSRNIGIEITNWNFLLRVWIIQTTKTYGSQKTTCLQPSFNNIFNNLSTTKPIRTAKICMTKIFSKETTATSRRYIPPILILLCFFIFCSSLGQTQPNATPILILGPLYDCSQPLQLGILSYSSLKNCSHSMLQQKAHTSPFRREVLQYSPIATTLPIFYPTLKSITMSCTYNKIFAGKQQR